MSSTSINQDLFGDDSDDEAQQRIVKHEPKSSRDIGDDDGNFSDNERQRDITAVEGDSSALDGQEGENEEDNVQLPSFRKRNADGDTSSAEPKRKLYETKMRVLLDGDYQVKKKQDGAAGDQAGQDGVPSARQAALEQLERDFENATKSGKTARRRKKDEEDIDGELDESASRFVSKMREAAFADIDAKLKKESSLHKVRMLESVKRQLNKSQVHNTFLDNGILEAMRLWLEPLHDASLPSLDIIHDFLVLLDKLPIQTDHLVNSGVGRVVYFYTKVDESRVTPTIKRLAGSLVDKWSRPIVKLSQDFRDKKISYADEAVRHSAGRRRPERIGNDGGEEYVIMALA
ncbi:Transcription factor iws1 [Actinomortierella ambigua]|uniref:Transcription factor iws1 n=1 Tax=Actinomortierella ambigua TaxID=1343610 RepID=A0A9P6QA44_9FUNG|nr:Transcription factor iws1 [Actinomortierella ambigua]